MTSLDPKSQEAIYATKNAAQAIEEARHTQIEAASKSAGERAAELTAERIAEKLLDESKISEIVETQMRKVLTQGSTHEREAIIARIPYVCEDIREMKLTLKDLQSGLAYIPLVQKLVFGLVGMVLVGIVGALLALILQ